MCKVSELNKRSRGMVDEKSFKEICAESRSFFESFAGILEEYEKQDSFNAPERRSMIDMIATVQIIALMLAENFGISDNEVCEAGCEIFDRIDRRLD